MSVLAMSSICLTDYVRSGEVLKGLKSKLNSAGDRGPLKGGR